MSPSAPRLSARKLGRQELAENVLAHARSDFVALSAGATVAEALSDLRARQVEDQILYLYATGPDGRLCGVVPTRRLLTATPEKRIAEIMVARVVALPGTATVEEACEFFLLHRYLAFPVVDAERRLVGVVDAGLFTDEVAGLFAERSSEDIFQLIGLHLEGARTASPWGGFRWRFPWLLFNIGGGLACALIAGMHERLLDSLVVLAIFLPVVLALAESVSIQAMTITLHRLHSGGFSLRAFAASAGRELAATGLLGLASGAVVAAVAWLWKRELPVAAAIGASILLSMLTASLLGVALPALVRALRRDPRVAAGPMTLAVADILTVLFYLHLSGWLLE